MSDWPKRLDRKDMTLGQRRCLDAIAWCFGGLHHVDGWIYECGTGIQTSTYQDLATFDGSILTRLVAVAHRRSVRIAIDSSGPRQVKIRAWPRKTSGGISERHATNAELRELLDKLDQWEEWSDET